MKRKDLEQIVSQIVSLPTLPEVAERVLALIDDDSTSSGDLETIVGRDPAMVAKVLRLANSAYYGLRYEVVNLRHAITILGFKTVKSIAFSLSLVETFKDVDVAEAFELMKFWRHSVVCAGVSRVVATEARAEDPEAAFVLGLIHDIGKLIVAQYAPHELTEIVRLAGTDDISFRDAEGEVLNTDHAQIGGWLAEKWSLADSIVAGIRDHHDADALRGDPTRASCELANCITKAKGLGCSGTGGRTKLRRVVWDTLGFERDILGPLARSVSLEIGQAENFLKAAA